MRVPPRQSSLSFTLIVLGLAASTAFAQIGRRFPSERKIVTDPVTGVPLTFLTSTPAGDSKIYPTHPQWTADGQWLVFRSSRVPGQAMAVHEQSGDIVQLTQSGYTGTLCVAQKAMKLLIMRPANRAPTESAPTSAAATGSSGSAKSGGGGPERPRGPMQIVEIDLGRLFADSARGAMAAADSYERVCGTLPTEVGASADMAIDATETVAYFRVGREMAAKHLPPDTKLEKAFGPRNMGAGPSGVGSMDLRTGAVKVVTAVPFQVGHIQANPLVPGEIMFCWETGGKAPQRTWIVMADGSGLRPGYPEAEYDWVTHEKFVTKDEITFAILGHRKPGVNDAWGISGTREHPTGMAIVNLRTRELHIAGQTKTGSGLWHVDASPDGRWAVGDDFSRSLHLIDRHTGEMMLLTTGHKPSAADHPHPTFSPDSTRFQIQSAMLSEDGRSMNICIVPVPEAWLKRTYAKR
jgi:oligogalacturonide lyase